MPGKVKQNRKFYKNKMFNDYSILFNILFLKSKLYKMF